jgi:hypothetical protein
MKHLVLIERPRERAVYVECKDIDDCLTVVEREAPDAPAGTRLTLIRKAPRMQGEPVMMWKVQYGQIRRYRVNPFRVASGVKASPHIIEAIAADLGCRPEDIA